MDAERDHPAGQLPAFDNRTSGMGEPPNAQEVYKGVDTVDVHVLTNHNADINKLL